MNRGPPRYYPNPMPDTPDHSSRRRFLGDALAIGASSLVLPPALARASTVAHDAHDADLDPRAIALVAPVLPSRVYVDHDGSGRVVEAARQGTRCTTPQGAVVELTDGASGLSVTVSA